MRSSLPGEALQSRGDIGDMFKFNNCLYWAHWACLKCVCLLLEGSQLDFGLFALGELNVMSLEGSGNRLFDMFIHLLWRSPNLKNATWYYRGMCLEIEIV